VTLHVGLGTFKPIESATLDAHRMHAELYEIDANAASEINRSKIERQRVIAVGTTSARVLESQPDGLLEPMVCSTDVFIKPPYRWRHVDSLITNFHQPRSTLIALVAAMIGLDEVKRCYAEAIARGYRFLSYGDAMWVE
jgi:S-adenosylmethionine:tRNA ribosyltransferase-isomerase